MPVRRDFNAFFSYSHLDAKATPRHVEPLAEELENIVTARLVNAELKVWRDKTHLLTGRRWNREIETRLRMSDILIVLFSPGWINSDYCRKEYTVFEEVERTLGCCEFVVPILVRPIDDQVEHLNDEQRPIYERLRERQFFPKLVVGGRGRTAAIEEVAGHIVQILQQRRASAIVDAVSADKSVPLTVLRDILEKLGEVDPLLDPDAIERRLRAKADEYAALQERLNRLSNDDPQVQRLREKASQLIRANDFAAADAALSQAERRDLDAVEEMEEIAKRRRISAAESRAERAAAARLQLDYHAAAAHYAKAAAILPVEETQRRWRYSLDRGRALYAAGGEFVDNTALHDAIASYRDALLLVSRTTAATDWATTQNDLGNALQVLGQRESGTDRLEEAASAFRAALQEWTRESAPLDWAMTQNNLGNVFTALGERESGTARLEHAVTAYRAALQTRPRADSPREWAQTQSNLGGALYQIGMREVGIVRLEEAVAAYRVALEELTQESAMLDWALTQNNLGSALTAIGERETGTVRLDEAVATFRATLEGLPRQRSPIFWATTQNNLGTALQALGVRESGTAHLGDAVSAFRAALAELPRESVPLDWAMTQNNLGSVLAVLGERESGLARFGDAIAAFDMALEVFVHANARYYVTVARQNRERAAAALAERRGKRRSRKKP